MSITIVKQGVTFTSFEFYNIFLKEIALFYKDNKQEKISFSLIDNRDNDIPYNKYRIDGNTLPLLLNIFEQLSSYHKEGVGLKLQNIIGHDKNLGTQDLISFLTNSNFFNIAQRQDQNYSKLEPSYPIIDIDKNLLPSKKLDSKFEIDCFSLTQDDSLRFELDGLNDEEKRDKLVEYYMFKVEKKFSKLFPELSISKNFLQNTTNIIDYKKFYIHVLPELITNGVLHSGANTFASLYKDLYKTKISVSDNGIGFNQSMDNKKNLGFYKRNRLKEELSKKNTFNINPSYLTHLHSIFETLYFSMLKNRLGLFDLICNVILMLDGVFRIHTENTQLILSKRVNDTIVKLYNKRKQIIKLHDEKLLEKISDEELNSQMELLSSQALGLFVDFYVQTLGKYTRDVKFSSIRFFPVRFKGVHIEVEIPN
ncbi:hypothetical protein [Elizabethkingia anophelis]|uniref:hypothetical protein n=1 Tax=Elizabethkingia anophelis TaxID=1117645 RepID=UPI0038918CE7